MDLFATLRLLGILVGAGLGIMFLVLAFEAVGNFQTKRLEKKAKYNAWSPTKAPKLVLYVLIVAISALAVAKSLDYFGLDIFVLKDEFVQKWNETEVGTPEQKAALKQFQDHDAWVYLGAFLFAVCVFTAACVLVDAINRKLK